MNDDTVVGQITRETAEENDCGRVTFYWRDLTPEIQALIRAGRMMPQMVEALLKIARSPTRDVGCFYHNKDKQQWAYECLRDIGHPYGRGKPEALAAYQAAIGGN